MTTAFCRFAVAAAFIVSLVVSPTTTATPKQDHCIIHLEPALPGQASRVTPGACFATLAESVMAATGNRIQLPNDATLDEIDQALEAQDAAAAADAGTAVTYVLSIEYMATDQTGSSRSFTGGAPCTATRGYNMGSMPSGWNDVISSSRGYSNCNKVEHYEHINYRGAVRACTPTCNTMGIMNNETSSMWWHHS